MQKQRAISSCTRWLRVPKHYSPNSNFTLRAVSTRCVRKDAARPVSSSRPRPLAGGKELGRPIQRRTYSSSAGSNSLQDAKTTPLYNLHLEHGAKMVPFGGYAMPVQYQDQSIADSALWTRNEASLFDVSHMVQHKFAGPAAAPFLERITPTAITSLAPFRSTYSCLLNDSGGIVDDTIITNITLENNIPTYHVVTNAGTHDPVIEYLHDQLDAFKLQHSPAHPSTDSTDQVSWEKIPNTGLVALQGPAAQNVLQSLTPKRQSQPFDLGSMVFSTATWLTIRDPASDGSATSPILVSRTGYTGEDGFELSVPHPEPTENATERVAKMILEAGKGKVKLAGLGARDVLRLEAGLCLYGHDIDSSKTPVEAGLAWVIAKSQRDPKANWNGVKELVKEDGKLALGKVRRRGFVLEGKAAAREGDRVFLDEQGEREIGVVTSGAPSPTLGKCIAMGYVPKDEAKNGVKVWIKVRGKLRPAEVSKMPFVETKYHKG